MAVEKKITSQSIAHLNIIQGVIGRMASNSFALKALAATLTAAIIALASGQDKVSPFVLCAGALPILVFWVLDAKYLHLEKLYRALYDHVRTGGKIEAFSMNVSEFTKIVPSSISLCFSWSVIWFYLIIFLSLVITGFLLKCL